MMATVSHVDALAALRGTARLDAINKLLDALELDREKTNLLPPVRNQQLEDLRAFTRISIDAGPLLSSRAVAILSHNAFDSNSLTTSRLAMRCLGNVLFHDAKLRQVFLDLGYASKCAERMKNDNREDELLTARILFLCTYDTRFDYTPLFTKNSLAETINVNLQRHAKIVSKRSSPADSSTLLALTETLKFLYNLTNFYPLQRPALTKSLLSILKTLSAIPASDPPLVQPTSALINAMIHLDLEDPKSRYFSTNPLFPLFDAKCNVSLLCRILDRALRAYPESEIDTQCAPILQLLVRISEFAPSAVKAHMCHLLLPSDSERDEALGKSDSLASHLLRLSASVHAPHMRKFVPALMFELSGKDVKRFVRNIGYGFAAGFLMSNKMEVPKDAGEGWAGGFVEEGEEDEELEVDELVKEGRDSGIGEGSGGEESAVRRSPRKKKEAVDINPITGQRRDKEPQDDGPPMSEDEKMREAERLFVLFERLRATGVVNVPNPIAEAVQSGKFESMGTDDKEDSD